MALGTFFLVLGRQGKILEGVVTTPLVRRGLKYSFMCVTDILAIVKGEENKSLRVLIGGAKNEILGPSGPSLMYLSVKVLSF